MRSLVAGIVLLSAAVCLAADGVPAAAPSSCSDVPGSPVCKAASKDLRAARQASPAV